MASQRKFGIVTTVDGFTGIKVNSLSRTFNSESAEARNEKGQIIDIATYGNGEQISVDGLFTGGGVVPGMVVQLGEDGKKKNYLITAASQSESNTAFKTQNVTARYAPSCEFWYMTTGGIVCDALSTINSDDQTEWTRADMISGVTTTTPSGN